MLAAWSHWPEAMFAAVPSSFSSIVLLLLQELETCSLHQLAYTYWLFTAWIQSVCLNCPCLACVKKQRLLSVATSCREITTPWQHRLSACCAGLPKQAQWCHHHTMYSSALQTMLQLKDLPWTIPACSMQNGHITWTELGTSIFATTCFQLIEGACSQGTDNSVQNVLQRNE